MCYLYYYKLLRFENSFIYHHSLASLFAQCQEFDLKHDHTNILVSDLEVSADFYENILQLRELETPWGVNPGVRFFSIGNGQQIHLAKVSADIIVTNKITHLAL